MANSELSNISQSAINQMRSAYSEKDSYRFIVTGNASPFNITLPETINLTPGIDHEITLIRFESYNSLFNVTAANNQFRYNNGRDWKIITLALGAHEITSVNKEIQRKMKLNNDCTIIEGKDTFHFKLFPNQSTLRSVIELSNNYKVDFSIPNSFKDILGYDAKVYNAPYNQSENIIKIQAFNSILIETDL